MCAWRTVTVCWIATDTAPFPQPATSAPPASTPAVCTPPPAPSPAPSPALCPTAPPLAAAPEAGRPPPANTPPPRSTPRPSAGRLQVGLSGPLPAMRRQARHRENGQAKQRVSLRAGGVCSLPLQRPRWRAAQSKGRQASSTDTTPIRRQQQQRWSRSCRSRYVLPCIAGEYEGNRSLTGSIQDSGLCVRAGPRVVQRDRR